MVMGFFFCQAEAVGAGPADLCKTTSLPFEARVPSLSIAGKLTQDLNT